jgi:hypothetical protein
LLHRISSSGVHIAFLDWAPGLEYCRNHSSSFHCMFGGQWVAPPTAGGTVYDHGSDTTMTLISSYTEEASQAVCFLSNESSIDGPSSQLDSSDPYFGQLFFVSPCSRTVHRLGITTVLLWEKQTSYKLAPLLTRDLFINKSGIHSKRALFLYSLSNQVRFKRISAFNQLTPLVQ